jgi:hypothetical protein
LETHAELLQPTIDTVLQELAAQQENEEVRKTIEDHRLLLQRCREIGVAAAFAERVASQDPRIAFLAALNRLCNEVVTVLRAKNAEQKEALASRLEQMAQGDLPVEDARVFLQVLVAWIRGQDTQALMRQVETLQPPFRQTYDRMVAAVEQEAELEHESQTTKEPSSE